MIKRGTAPHDSYMLKLILDGPELSGSGAVGEGGWGFYTHVPGELDDESLARIVPRCSGSFLTVR